MSIDCYCDYDPPEFATVATRRARKSYRCDECSGTISVGEPYEYTFGKWEGYLDQYRICERCYDIRQWTKNNVPCLCWAYGNITQDCSDAIDEARSRAPDETLGLRFGFLRRVHMRDKFNAERKTACQ